MRILRLHFKNLNSLVGEWEIDFTLPAYLSEGIFAITGPTGAGKTTILDAICLGLYGRTPRLSKVTKNDNEIMSRQTGECFSEVAFETQAGRFWCHWSQRRARKKSGGELQPPKHEIANADSGQIFETRLRGVAEQVETVTGMDFDRFTRSMLLAQGGFAAFLQAVPDERAPILEQITGTEIYSQISMQVHARRSEERKRLDALQVELAGMQLLTPEEEQQLAISLEHMVRQDAELSQQMTQKNQAITWIESIARLERELKEIGQAKDELQARLAAFVPEQERLKFANQALELAADYAALTATRKAQDADQASLCECQESFVSSTDVAKKAEEAMNKAVDQLETRKVEQQKMLPVIRKVRELDLKIAEKDSPIKAVNDSIVELSTSLEALKTKQKNDSDALSSKRKVLEELQALLEATKADERLVEHLAGIRGRFEVLKSRNVQLAGKIDEITQAGKQSQEALRAWQEQSTNLESLKRGRDEFQVSLTGKQAELQETLKSRELAEWRKSQSLLATQKDLIVKALVAAQTMSKSKQAIHKLGGQRANLSAEEVSLSSMLATQNERHAVLEKEMSLLETQLTLLKRIEDLEEARGQLQDGEPCPLCGAHEHPFAKGNIPVPEKTQQRLTTVRAEFKFVTGELSNLRIKRVKVSKDLEQIASAQKEYTEKITQASREIGDICSVLSLDPRLTVSDPLLEEKFKELQEENSRQITYVASILETVESAEKALVTLRESLEKGKDFVMKAEREVQAAIHKKDSAGKLLERLRKEADGYRDQQEKSIIQLQKEIESFGIETLSIDCLDMVLEQLTVRRDQWVTRNNKKTGLEKNIAALELQTRHQVEQRQKVKNDLKKQQELLASLLCDRESFCRERQELFGDRKTDEEEVRHSKAIESAEKVLGSARQKLSTANQAANQLKAKIDTLEQAIRARGRQLKSAGEAFQVRLKMSGFIIEENFKSACLPESERKHLTQQSQKLSDEKAEITSKECEKTKLLETERRKKITYQALEDLKNAQMVLVGNQKHLQQEIGGIRQKLNDHESLKQKQQNRVQAIDAQKRECSRWDLLHELIGSADGKKYRNFAQGLTLEMMIGHANRQLQKMTDRYLLIRDDKQPLELNIIDNYQAGVVRSTKNLSGGESFIVSLSLALGLSHMASKNVRVDSLFLDEGFGTLDEEALDTALETLARLQQDGKLIGVISHVPALKERISTQIQVIPQTGGRSVICGPGCGKSAQSSDA